MNLIFDYSENCKVRPCGGGWEYCNGECYRCRNTKISTTSTSSSITKNSESYIDTGDFIIENK